MPWIPTSARPQDLDQKIKTKSEEPQIALSRGSEAEYSRKKNAASVELMIEKFLDAGLILPLVQSCKSGWAFRVGFGPGSSLKLTKFRT